MSETNQEARLRLFLAEYERVCKRYSLMVWDSSVYESTNPVGRDDLPSHMSALKRDGIRA